MASGEHDLDTHLQLRTDDRSLEGTLRVGPKVPVEHIDASVFAIYLEARGIPTRLIDRELIAALIERIKSVPGSEHASIVARGVEPRDAEPRVLEWSPRIADQIRKIADRKQALADENTRGGRPAVVTEEKVNFYEQSAFIIVQAGEVLGSISPPDPGEDGEDIFGNVLPAKQAASPADIDPETIELTREHKLIAKARGRLVYLGTNRHIERTLTVPEDVGFETGNIDFPGPVEIGGGVRDKFVVRATGTVSVRKLVEASFLESRRDIVLERGAAGRDIGRIVAGTDLRAGYLEGASVECAEDCIVKHEITNCRVRVRGTVKIPAGAIRGGVIVASKGVEAGVVGSAQETRTELVIGSVEDLDGLLREARDLIDDVRTALEPLRSRLPMLKAGAGKHPRPDQTEAINAIESELSEGDRRVRDLEEAALRLESNLGDTTHTVLRVAQCIHAGVVLWMPGHKAVFRNEVKGESVIRLNAANDPVIEYRGEVHPLAKFATIEQDERVVPRHGRPDPQATEADGTGNAAA
jgi:uncharacterized protein (DUF342 family)